MTAPNSAIDAFVREIAPEKIWAEVLIESSVGQFTLRHVHDREVALDQLNRITIPEARKLATFTALGQFRPLRSSPDLPRGWVLTCAGAAELWLEMNGRRLMEGWADTCLRGTYQELF